MEKRLRRALAASQLPREPPEVSAARAQGLALAGFHGYWDMAGIVQAVKQGRIKNVVALCGAGVSVSAGIPGE